MIIKHITTYLVLFAISYGVILHEANVSDDVAFRIAAIIAVIKSAAVALINRAFDRINRSEGQQ